jgi:hypothetical protein
MAKSLLRKTLDTSPRAKRHAGTIKSTLKALKALNAAGVEGSTYNLAPPYGGSRKPDVPTPRKLPKIKMTYYA